MRRLVGNSIVFETRPANRVSVEVDIDDECGEGTECAEEGDPPSGFVAQGSEAEDQGAGGKGDDAGAGALRWDSADMGDEHIEIRPPATDGERLQAEDLVRRSLEPEWRFGGHAIKKAMADALLGVNQGEVTGVVAFQHGSRAAINVVAVSPALRRQGLGTRLVGSACAELRQQGATDINVAGSGPYLWPGIPRNIPGAVEFFTANSWQIAHDVHDLVRSLPEFVAPYDILQRTRDAGVEFGSASLTERDWLAANASEHWYPGWDGYFATSAPENIVVGRKLDDGLVGALIIGLPGQPEGWHPMLGPGITTIGCVGTLRDWREHGIGTALVAFASEMLRDAGGSVCHIGWTVLLSFYGRLGYEPWRTYAIATREM